MRVSLLLFVAEDVCILLLKKSVIEKEKEWEGWVGWVCPFIRVGVSFQGAMDITYFYH